MPIITPSTKLLEKELEKTEELDTSVKNKEQIEVLEFDHVVVWSTHSSKRLVNISDTLKGKSSPLKSKDLLYTNIEEKTKKEVKKSKNLAFSILEKVFKEKKTPYIVLDDTAAVELGGLAKIQQLKRKHGVEAEVLILSDKVDNDPSKHFMYKKMSYDLFVSSEADPKMLIDNLTEDTLNQANQVLSTKHQD